MATKSVLKAAIWLLSTPFLLSAKICRLCNILNVRSDLIACSVNLGKYAHHPISDQLFTVLRLGEDHRNALHFGVDPIAICRAMWKNITRKGFEGASTIEQQFVRASTGRFEKTIRRKFREQMLAVSLGRIATKREIASAFIAIVHYGDQYNGPLDILVPFGALPTNASFFESALLVARIKYPEPFPVNFTWLRRFSVRVSYLLQLSHVSPNALQ